MRPRDGFTIGVDLGGTNVRAAVVDENGRILGADRHRLQSKEPPQVAEAIVRASKTACAAAGIPFAEAQGMGVGIAGMIQKGTGMVLNGPNLGWRDVPISKLLAARTPKIPLFIANDLSAAVWGERMAGAGRGVDDLLVVLVGTGVGSGMVQNGQLIHGGTGVAGEFGHVKVNPVAFDPSKPSQAGRLCGCGMRGCLEAYAGGQNLAAWARDDLRIGAAAQRASGLPVTVGKRLLELVNGEPEKITAAAMERAAHLGDELSRRLLDEAARLVGFSLANLLTVLNPSKILLGGGVLANSPRMTRQVIEAVDLYASKVARAACTIGSPQLGDDAGVVGAALLARDIAA